MNKLLASDLGFLGINVDSNFDLAWLKTEVANKIKEGDITSIYKLINFARHSEDPKIRDYAVIIENLYKDKVEAYEQFPKKDEATVEVETPVTPENPTPTPEPVVPEPTTPTDPESNPTI